MGELITMVPRLRGNWYGYLLVTPRRLNPLKEGPRTVSEFSQLHDEAVVFQYAFEPRENQQLLALGAPMPVAGG